MNKKQKKTIFLGIIISVLFLFNACDSYAGGAIDFRFPNPIMCDDVECFLIRFLAAIQKIAGLLALVFIVVGGLYYVTSAGNMKMIEKGKKTITSAIIGLVVGIGAPSILKELAIIMGWIDISSQCNPGDASCRMIEQNPTISQIALNVLSFLLGISGILAMVMFVIGGIVYLTSTGDQDRIESGKKIFTYSLIGIIIIFSSMVLVKQIAMFFVAG